MNNTDIIANNILTLTLTLTRALTIYEKMKRDDDDENAGSVTSDLYGGDLRNTMTWTKFRREQECQLRKTPDTCECTVYYYHVP